MTSGKVKVSESGMKSVEVIVAYKHGRYEKIGLKSFRVMFNVKFFATQNEQTGEHDSLHRLKQWTSPQISQ